MILEEESVDFKRERRASESPRHMEMAKAGERDLQKSDANNGKRKATSYGKLSGRRAGHCLCTVSR